MLAHPILGVSSPGSESSDGDVDAGKDSDDDFDAELVPLNAKEIMEEFCDTWIKSLNHDQRISLGLFILFQLILLFKFNILKKEEYTAIIVHQAECTICNWKKQFFLRGEVQQST